MKPQKTTEPGFYKTQNAIINMDNSELEAYKKRKRLYESVHEIDNLKKEVGDIKDMLQQILLKIG